MKNRIKKSLKEHKDCMINKLKTCLVNYLKIDTALLEFSFALFSISVGLKIILPSSAALDFPPYLWLKTIVADESFWGWLIMVIGILRLVTLFLGNLRARRVIALAGMSLWLLLDLSFWISVPNSIGGLSYLMHVLLTAWILSSLTYREYIEHATSNAISTANTTN